MTIWQVPNHFPTLKNDRVHIWRANLKLSTQQIERLETCLSTDEIVRAQKFRFPQHKRRFIAARGILRHLLSGYLGRQPQNLCFTYGNKGKPHLDQNQATQSPLQFNLSHSQEYALFGFNLQHLIGVDLEYQRPMPDALKIARRFFAEREFQMLAESDREQQSLLFFQLWTAKEAYLKAVGTGLADSLARVEIACDRSNSLSLLAIQEQPEAVMNWSLFSCTPAANYAAAIAINTEGTTKKIDYWHWQSKLIDPAS
ncbi:MAG: 4'-phosphopantetheinyl transferase superfamily protein [Cyanobacteria bacterium J06600_6]